MTIRRTCGFLLLALLLASSAQSAEHTKDSLDKVKELLATKQAVIIDVREQGEWDRGHLQNAQLWPLSVLKQVPTDADVKDKLEKKLPKDRIVYCHCAKGVRALTAGNLLEKLGYDVRPLAVGYEQLLEAGFPPAKK